MSHNSSWFIRSHHSWLMTQFIINQIASQIVRIVNQTQLIQWLQHVKSQVCCCQNLSVRLSEKVPNFIFCGVRKESINLQALVTRSNPIQLNPSDLQILILWYFKISSMLRSYATFKLCNSSILFNGKGMASRMRSASAMTCHYSSYFPWHYDRPLELDIWISLQLLRALGKLYNIFQCFDLWVFGSTGSTGSLQLLCRAIACSVLSIHFNQKRVSWFQIGFYSFLQRLNPSTLGQGRTPFGSGVAIQTKWLKLRSKRWRRCLESIAILVQMCGTKHQVVRRTHGFHTLIKPKSWT